MSNTLEIDSVILEFGSKRILQDVYLKCETGFVTGLLGRNGSGKSCLMKIIYGELVPIDKSVRLNKIAFYDNKRNPEDIMFLPQFSFIPKFLSLDNIFKQFRLDFSVFATYFPEFINFRNERFRNLSGGAQRIVEIYSILVSDSKFCMLDEPFSQVMPLHVETIKNLILKEKANKGIIVTDHLYKNIIEICDQLYIIKDGKTYLAKDLEDIEKLGYARIN